MLGKLLTGVSERMGGRYYDNRYDDDGDDAMGCTTIYMVNMQLYLLYMMCY